jgi:tetratricopeptide (TPR) repeat protein
MKSKLLIPKEEFRVSLQLRIAEGQTILSTFDGDEGKVQGAFEKLEKAFRMWNSYNKTWLEQSFSESSNEYYQGYLDANTSSLEEMIAITEGWSSTSLRYRLRFFRGLVTPKIEYLEDLLAKLDFVTLLPQTPALPEAPTQFATHLQAMNSEEIIKKQASEAVTVAERYGIHNHQGKYVEALREQSLKLYQPAAKAIYFQEAIHLVEEKIVAHRAVCKEGPGCPKEKKYEEAIFFLQQELDILPKPTLTPASTHQPASMPPLNTGIEKIFISHSSKDAGIVEEVIDLLEIIGVKHEQIFCSSFEGYSIGLGQDFLQRIKDELNGNVLVLFIITSNFYGSPVSLCEMGAAWVKTSKHIPIVVPPLSYDDVKGVIPLTQGFIINEPLKWNTLKQQLEEWFTIHHSTSLSVWERKRDKAIQAITNKIQPLAPPLQRAKVRDLKRGDSTSAV